MSWFKRPMTNGFGLFMLAYLTGAGVVTTAVWWVTR